MPNIYLDITLNTIKINPYKNPDKREKQKFI